eukprot:2270401-Lingulodinium_polyedra.AAC.1
MLHTLVVHGRVHSGHRYHRPLCSDGSTGMGIVCIIKGWSDPMYVVPDYESSVLYAECGNNDRDPDSG